MEQIGRGWRLPDSVIQVAIISVGFLAAAFVSSASTVLAFGVLLAIGFLLGARFVLRMFTLVIGAAASALLIYWWWFIRDHPPDTESGLRNGISSALLISLILAAAFILPGYLFGRAYRRSVEPIVADVDGSDVGAAGGQAPPLAVRTYVVAGCLILVGVLAAIVWLVRSLSMTGP